MKKELILMIALLCAIAQGAWAQVITFPIQYDDVWDGHASTKPTTFDNDYLVINTAAELVYAREHWQEKADNGIGYYEQKYSLNANLNMGLGFSWKPMKNFYGEFHGNGHTICIRIRKPENYAGQGLFGYIGNTGKVCDLHLTGTIDVDDWESVGGIAGACDGLIENCWVSADVSSNGSDLGGICGFYEGSW
jgi:hypothetical protein